MRKLLLTVALLSCCWTGWAAAGIKISALPTTNAGPATALIIVDQPILGHSTNDTFATTVADLFNNYLGTQLWTNGGTYIAPTLFPDKMRISTDGTLEVGRGVSYWAPGSSDILTGVHDVSQGDFWRSEIFMASVDNAAANTNLSSFHVRTDTDTAGGSIRSFLELSSQIAGDPGPASFTVNLQADDGTATMALVNRGTNGFQFETGAADQIVWGPGGTTVLVRYGNALVWTNTATSNVNIEAHNGDGKSTAINVSTGTGALQTSEPLLGLTAGSKSITVDSSNLALRPGNPLEMALGTEAAPWSSGRIGSTNQWQFMGVTSSIPHVAINGVDYALSGVGGTTINPTDGTAPYRINATTFGDSALRKSVDDWYLNPVNGSVHIEGASGFDSSLGDEDQWLVLGTAGNLVPKTMDVYAVGTSTRRVREVFTKSLVWYDGTVVDTFGSGSPEGAYTAGVGSVYRDTNGTPGAVLYVKESGDWTTNVGWVAHGGGGGGGTNYYDELDVGQIFVTNTVQATSFAFVPHFVSTANYTITTNNGYVSVNGAWTNTLPPANSVVCGRWFTVKAATTNGATVWLSAGDTIDYSITNESLPFPTSRNYMSDGTNNWQRW